MWKTLRKALNFVLWTIFIGLTIGIVFGIVVRVFVFFQKFSWPRFSWLWIVPYSWGSIIVAIIFLVGGSFLFWSILKRTKTEGDKKTDANIGIKKEDKKTSKEKESSKSVWWSRLWKTATVLLVLWVGFSVYRHLFPTTSSSILSRTPAGTNMSHSVPVEIALPIIADCETGGGVAGAAKQFIDEEKKIPMRNPQDGKPGTGAVGKWRINLSDKTIAGIVKTNKWDVESSESDNKLAAEYLYGIYRTNPWTASQPCWEQKLRAYTWGGNEAVSIVIKAPVEGWSERIPTPYRPKRWDINGFGKKYRVLWNEKIEEDLPDEPETQSKQPEIVYSMRFKSLEPESINITLRMF